MTIGTPMLKLDHKDHYSSKGKERTHGNIEAVVHEADEERHCGDESLDKDMTQHNRFYVGEALGVDPDSGIVGQAYLDTVERFEKEYPTRSGKSLRSNQLRGAALIVKPSGDDWDGLEADEQEIVLDVINRLIYEHLKEECPGVELGFRTDHVDEWSIHSHNFFLDRDMSLSKMFSLPMKSWLNHEMPVILSMELARENPDISRKLDIRPLASHRDETPEERKERRKNVGLDSKEYKARKKQKSARAALADTEKATARERDKLRKVMTQTNDVLSHLSEKKQELRQTTEELSFATDRKKEAIRTAQEAERQTEQARRNLEAYEIKAGSEKRKAEQAEAQRKQALAEASQAKAETQRALQRKAQAEVQERQALERITELKRQEERLKQEVKDLGIAVNTGLQTQQVSGMTSYVGRNEDGIPTVVKR